MQLLQRVLSYKSTPTYFATVHNGYIKQEAQKRNTVQEEEQMKAVTIYA